ncbi:MAG: outer membrane protein assembly factor [Bacteroidales bacterium]|jgi:outer membrane protein assembly factor BamA|nr:outer membrane protein assembly factor [Bacteroidales bacterium]
MRDCITKSLYRLPVLIIILLYSQLCVAQTTDTLQKTALKDTNIVVRRIGFINITRNPYQDSIKNHRKLRAIPVVVAGYTPELGALFGAGGLFTYRSNPYNQALKPNIIPFNILYTTEGAFVFRTMYSLYFLKDRLRVRGELSIKNMDDNYWGVGYKKGRAISKPDTSTKYHKEYWNFNPRITFQLFHHLHAGIKLNYSRTNIFDASDMIKNDYHFIKQGRFITNTGLGLVAEYDTRDFPESATKGTYIGLSSDFYFSGALGDFNYRSFEVDIRKYIQLIFCNDVLAVQFKSIFTDGDVPWTDMPKLGSVFGLRGYHMERYRDKMASFVQVEYRYMFKRRNTVKRDLFIRHGFAIWGGAGTVANSFADVNDILPNYGVGYRVELMRNVIGRADFGIGNDTNAFYFTINQAF